MASSIHYLIIDADNPQEAMDAVWGTVANWGSEDQSKHIVGAIDTNGVKYVPEDPAYGWNQDDLDETTLESINTQIQGYVTNPMKYIISTKEDALMMSLLLQFVNKWVDNQEVEVGVLEQMDISRVNDLAALAKNFKESVSTLRMMREAGINQFDLWQAEYRSWELDEWGVTDLRCCNDKPNQYCVLLWVHS